MKPRDANCICLSEDRLAPPAKSFYIPLLGTGFGTIEALVDRSGRILLI
jgi:hypothetical protein